MTDYGTAICSLQADLFEYTREQLNALALQMPDGESTCVALSGGSTPKNFYEFLAHHGGGNLVLERLRWTTSDERVVPIEDEQSNFGQAQRLFFKPCHIPSRHQLPWPTQEPSAASAESIAKSFQEQLKTFAPKGIHTCFLGMGDDGHTASLWPGCPLLKGNPSEGPHFAATLWPQRGWRLTITPAGLHACRRILVLVAGHNKAVTLKKLFNGNSGYPIEVLKPIAQKVTFLIAAEAWPV